MKTILTIVKCFIPMLILMGIQFICALFTAIFGLQETNNLVMKQMLIYDIIGLGLFGYTYITNRENKEEFFTKRSAPLIILLFASLEVSISGMLSIITALMPSLMDSYVTHVENMGVMDMNLLSILVVIILTPILEEIVYRGIVLNYANKEFNRFMFANIVQAIIFGINHLNLIQGIYAFMMGLILGYVYKRYNTIFVPIIAHITFNLLGTYGVSIIFGSVTEFWQVILITGSALIITMISFIVIKKNDGTVLCI